MNLHHINVIAGYEVKLLRRSWLFRVFAILTLVMLTFMQLGMLTPIFWKYSETWNGTALTSLVPFFSIYYYNIAQSIIVIFLAGSFLKRDKKLDTAEVIYVRPMSNADYIVGKVWGILRVFLSLNIITFLIAAFVNLVAASSPFSLFPYIFYLLTISVPSLLFILGLSFTIMCLLKNQAVTFIVMLGIVGTAFFYLNESLFGVFDFFGVNIPSIFSDVMGMAHMDLFLLQRGIYLLSGIGLLCFTITLVKRLPHRPWKNVVINIVASIIVIAGGCAGVAYVLHFKHIEQVRLEFAGVFDKYASVEKARVLSNHITVEQKGSKLEAVSVMNLTNRNAQVLKEIILYLNPALQIAEIRSGGKSLPFTRDRQVVTVQHTLAPDSSTTLTVAYAGGIDENVCYTDVEDKEFFSNPTPLGFFYRLGKRYAYLEKRYTLLTPETMWYPTAIPPVNPAVPYNLRKNFSDYTLTVVNPGKRTVISQGNGKEEENRIVFTNRTLLSGISLTIGDYEKKAITVDSTDYEIYHFKGHDFFSKHFSELTDTLPDVIRDFRSDLEVQKGRMYPFNKFVLAETPAQFTGYIRNWKGYTESVMPEVVFMPERGLFTGADFRAATHRTRDWRNSEDLLEEKDVQIEMFKNFLRTAFIDENASGTNRGWQASPEVNKLNVGSMFFGHTGFVYSPEYPVFDVALNMLLNIPNTLGEFNMWRANMAINDPQRANMYLQSHSLETATKDRVIKPHVFYELLKLKSNFLKNYITTRITAESFNSFVAGFAERHRFEEIGIEIFIEDFENEFGINLMPFLETWYRMDHSPTLTIKDMDANKVIVEDFTKYQVKFKINNPSDVDGIITIKITGGNMRGMRAFGGGGNNAPEKDVLTYIIPASSAQEIKLINDDRPGQVTVNTTISNNLPNNFTFNFSKIDNEISDTIGGMAAISPLLFAPDPKEIIIDNEDEGFQLINPSSKKKLKDLFRKEEEEKYQNLIEWRPPSKWTATVSSHCYGTSVNSAYYKKAGTGAHKAEWKMEVAKGNYYEVFVWNPALQSMQGRHRRDHEERSQTFTIAYDQEKEDVVIDFGQEEAGWISIGSFYLPEGTVTVTTSDKVTGELAVADAVKFVISGGK